MRPPVLCRRIIPALTARAGERDDVAHGLLRDLRYDAGAHRPPPFPNRKPQLLLHPDRLDQLDPHRPLSPPHPPPHPPPPETQTPTPSPSRSAGSARSPSSRCPPASPSPPPRATCTPPSRPSSGSKTAADTRDRKSG